MMEMEDFKTIGFKQMHQMQIDTLINYISTAVEIAASLGDPVVLAEVEEESDELIKMFGGKGLFVTVTTGELVVRTINTHPNNGKG